MEKMIKICFFNCIAKYAPGIVDQVQERGLQQLRHGQGALHANQRNFREHHAALADGVDLHVAGVQVAQVGEKLGVGTRRQHRLQVDEI